VSGFPVGVGSGTHKEHVVALKPGDRLLLYTDGLTGARNAEGEHFGARRLLEALEQTRRAPLAEYLGGLARAVEGWRGEVPRHDDISVLVVERTEPASANRGSSEE
jgi:phosphoserine phosphatase RsbU/P